MSNILLFDTGCCHFICPWWLLWTLVAFLLGALLHHLLFCKGKQDEIDKLILERDGYHAQYINAEKDLASIKYQLDQANKEVRSLKSALHKCEADVAGLKAHASMESGAGGAALGFAAGAASRGLGAAPASRGTTNFATILGSDNLQIVEGIGPKIDGLLKADGINTWGELAASSPERLKGILDVAGSRYRLADPKTWPQQAKLAHENKWDELIEYQKFLDTGTETKGDFENPSKVEKLIAKLMGYSTNPNDLKVVEGIGPKIEGLFKDAGIKTWSDLAAASMDRLQGILNDAGDRYRLADPSTWPKQAGLAAAGNWDELKTYQEFLDGGKTPG